MLTKDFQVGGWVIFFKLTEIVRLHAASWYPDFELEVRARAEKDPSLQMDNRVNLFKRCMTCWWLKSLVLIHFLINELILLQIKLEIP